MFWTLGCTYTLVVVSGALAMAFIDINNKHILQCKST